MLSKIKEIFRGPMGYTGPPGESANLVDAEKINVLEERADASFDRFIALNDAVAKLDKRNELIWRSIDEIRNRLTLCEKKLGIFGDYFSKIEKAKSKRKPKKPTAERKMK